MNFGDMNSSRNNDNACCLYAYEWRHHALAATADQQPFSKAFDFIVQVRLRFTPPFWFKIPCVCSNRARCTTALVPAGVIFALVVNFPNVKPVAQDCQEGVGNKALSADRPLFPADIGFCAVVVLPQLVAKQSGAFRGDVAFKDMVNQLGFFGVGDEFALNYV